MMKTTGMLCGGQSRVAVAMLCGMLAGVLSTDSQAADAEAAKMVAKQNGCLKCHNYTREKEAKKPKDGKPWYEVAAKYRDKPDAEATLLTHINTGPKTKFPDGYEEEHKIIKTKDEAKQKNLVNWILTLQ